MKIASAFVSCKLDPTFDSSSDTLCHRIDRKEDANCLLLLLLLSYLCSMYKLLVSPFQMGSTVGTRYLQEPSASLLSEQASQFSLKLQDYSIQARSALG